MPARNDRTVRHHATADYDFTDEETVFLAAVQRYQRKIDKKFLTYTDILRLVKNLGYARVEIGDTAELTDAMDSFDDDARDCL